MLVKEVANISTDVLSELGKLVSAYKDYTETLAAVQKQIEYTKEYKEKQTQSQSVQRGRNVVFAVKRRCHAENLRIKEKDGLRFRAFFKLYAVSSFRSGGNLI